MLPASHFFLRCYMCMLTGTAIEHISQVVMLVHRHRGSFELEKLSKNMLVCLLVMHHNEANRCLRRQEQTLKSCLTWNQTSKILEMPFLDQFSEYLEVTAPPRPGPSSSSSLGSRQSRCVNSPVLQITDKCKC